MLSCSMYAYGYTINMAGSYRNQSYTVFNCNPCTSRYVCLYIMYPFLGGFNQCFVVAILFGFNQCFVVAIFFGFNQCFVVASYLFWC